MRSLLCLCALLLFAAAPAATAQNWGQLEGRVTERGTASPVPGASVIVDGTGFGTAADASGAFRLRLPEGRYLIRVSSVGYETRADSVRIVRNATSTVNVSLAQIEVELGGVEVQADVVVRDAGVQTLDPRTAQDIPSPLSDGFRALQVLMGVATSTETSYQYSVRGGGYNENLYFIDGFEVYTPFRTRQGEQEGLGLVNLDITESMTLYTGGFPARYGGKLASALDVQYLRPRRGFGGSAYASALDAGGTVYGAVLDGRLGLAVAGRRSRPSGFFGSQELKGEYDPTFTDVQGTVTYRLAEGHEIQGLGFYLNHRFRLDPRQRRTYFGTFQDLRSVSFAYEGQEEDGYDLAFGGLRLVNRLAPGVYVEHDVSLFDVIEFEEYDIAGSVALFRVDDVFQNPNDPTNLISTGAARQRDFADNRVRVSSLTANGRYRLARGRHAAEAGWTGRLLRFDDRILEGSAIAGRDSAGLPATVEQVTRGEAEFDEWQAAVYAQNSFDVLSERNRLIVTAGLRGDYFSFNDEWTVSPRLSARFVLDPATTLLAAGGLYHQAPTYRELRGEPIFDAASDNVVLAALNRNLRSQRAQIYTVGLERFFPSIRFYGRAEAYYKHLSNLISYDVANVRTVYSGENDSRGSTYGMDLQIRGEFVPGLESWLNYGLMFAQEEFEAAFSDSLRSGVLPRPTDRRHNVSMFVQDYVPGSDSWRLHLRALFGTGTPYTPPTPGRKFGNVELQDPGPRAAARYPEYRRFDMGLTKESRIGVRGPTGALATLELTGEVLNVFNMTNTIAYTWIAGSDGVWQRVPTRLTPRQVNVRLRVRF
jgi:hypothetical protein